LLECDWFGRGRPSLSWHSPCDDSDQNGAKHATHGQAHEERARKRKPSTLARILLIDEVVTVGDKEQAVLALLEELCFDTVEVTVRFPFGRAGLAWLGRIYDDLVTHRVSLVPTNRRLARQ
jgi:hypothetical protein